MPVDTPGLTIGKPHDHMGARLLPTSELFLEDVHIPERYLIGGEENMGFEQNLVHDPVVLLMKNTIILGTLRALYEESVRYARERVVCGNPIITYPTIKVMLSDMRGKLEAARTLLWRCAWEIDREPMNTKRNNEMGYLVKAFMNEWTPNFLRNADEIHGGMGTNREMLVEKLISSHNQMKKEKDELLAQLQEKQQEILELNEKVKSLDKDRSDMHTQVTGLIDRIGEWEKVIDQEITQQDDKAGEQVQNMCKESSTLFNTVTEQPL